MVIAPSIPAGQPCRGFSLLNEDPPRTLLPGFDTISGPMPPTLVDQLDLLIRARTPILWIRSLEEERVVALLGQVADLLGGRTLLEWDFIGGLSGAPNRLGEAARNPMAALDALSGLAPEQGAILLLKDFHRYAEDAGICRRLRNLASQLRQVPQTLVISAPDWTLPRELEDSITVLDLPLPDAAEISRLLGSIARASGAPLASEVLEQLTAACHGLSEQRVRQLAARALARRGQLGLDDLNEVLEEKRQAIARSALLEYCPTEPPRPISADWMPSNAGWSNAAAPSARRRSAMGCPCRVGCCWWVRRARANPSPPRRSPTAGACRCCASMWDGCSPDWWVPARPAPAR